MAAAGAEGLYLVAVAGPAAAGVAVAAILLGAYLHSLLPDRHRTGQH